MPPDLVKLADNLELDRRAYELRRSGEPLRLSRIPMELLLLLVERRGELVTRDEIVERIWGKDVFLDTDNSINAAIRKLRQVLVDDPEQPRFVQTITGMGYRFIAQVVEVNPPVVEPSAPEKPSPISENLAGKKVSHYRILQVLGGGGMGVVYKAEDLKLGRRVAIKFLPAEMAGDADAFERMKREARASSALDHRNICSIHELGEHEGQPFIVMQLLEGQTVREWIETMESQSTPQRLTELLDVAIQIADGLEVAHQHGIVHRDVKPANLFITNRGEAKILDFGVAKFLETQEVSSELSGIAADGIVFSNPALTRTGASIGTPSYLSPEQIRGEKLDGRTDLFSFGLVLYEMATGERAFAGNTAPVIREAVLNQPTVPIRQLRPDLPAGLEKVVNKALEKDRDRRYQTAGELRTDLDGLRREQTPAIPKSNPRGIWLAVGIAAIVVMGAFILSLGVRDWLRSSAASQTSSASLAVKPRRSVAVLGFNNLSGKDEESWISTALSEMLSTELAAGQHLRVIPRDRIVRMQLDLGLHSTGSYSPDLLSRIRKNLGTDVVVLGSYLAIGKDSGGKVRVDMQVQDADSGEIVGAISQNGTETDLADLASRGGEGLRHQLGLRTISSSDLREIQASIPTNPEAARLYAEGLDKLRVFDAAAARDLLQKAIAADPNHALAHAALARSWSFLGYDAKAQEEAKRAFDLSANLSREERLSIEGRYRELTHDFPAAIEIYRTLRNFFPDDLDYGLRLAQVQISGSLGSEALQTLARTRALPDPQSADARIDITEANALESISDYKRAQVVAAMAAEKARAQGSRLLEAEANQKEGWAWDRLGDVDKAMEHMVRSRDLAAAGGNERLSATVLVGLGNVMYDKGDLPGARKAYEEAYLIYNRIGAIGASSSPLNNLGNVFYDQGKLDEARHYYGEALGASREVSDLAGTASALGSIANVLDRKGDLAGATAMQQQSLQAFRESGDKRGEASTLDNLGGLQFERGELEAAKESYEQAAKLQEEIAYKRGRGFVLTGLATILRAEDRLGEARTSLEQAISLRKELKDEVDIAQDQVLLGDVALEQGQGAEAESLTREARTVFDKQKVVDCGCPLEAVLTRALLAQGRTKEAQASAERALTFSRQTTDRSSRFEAILATADAGLASGKLAGLEKTLETVVSDASKQGYAGYQLEARLRLGEIELRSGKTSAGRARLEQLSKDAQAKGFLLIARKANSALGGETHRS